MTGRLRSALENSVKEARAIGTVPANAILPFPTYALMMRLRTDGAMQKIPDAPQCSMAALLDCRATLEAILADNFAFLIEAVGISEEIRKRRASQCHLKASIEHLNSIINAKRIDTR